ncbi:flagellar biosynthesis protein FlgG, partial [Campylobacter jejuni]|nr:flagellar biosynthesis protein FlgG [Campylobacter jejuni]
KKAAENDPVVSSTKEYLGVSSYYSNIDIANTIKQYYNLFSNALGQSFPNDKTSFSEADTGLKDFSNSLISNVYKTPEQAKEADEI